HREVGGRAGEDRHDARADTDARRDGGELGERRESVLAPGLAHAEAAIAEVLGEDGAVAHLAPRHAGNVHAHDAYIAHVCLRAFMRVLAWRMRREIVPGPATVDLWG